MNLPKKSKVALWGGPGAFVLLAVASACSGKVSSKDEGLGSAGRAGGAPASGGSGGAVAGGSANGGTGAQAGNSPIIPVGNSGGEGGEDGQNPENGGAAGDSNLCATVSATAELQPVYLAFAFDVSGSMGNLELPWYDPVLKWDPAVAATRGFFEDESSAGLFASLTSFPIATHDEPERCTADNYSEPDVAMRELPSTKFGDALDAIRAGEWRGGTPTRAVIDGVMGVVSSYREDHPGHHAIVLVTDGYPNGCGADNTIEAISGVVSASADDVPTYVIGVKNPPLVADDGTEAPDTVSDLNSVAEAGGTDSAFIIDTGDPEKTQVDFRKAVDAIRGAAIACSLAVPTPPDGRTFEKDHVVVSTTAGDKKTDLRYDEDCKGDDAWHYDSVSKPTEVVLCPKTCTGLQDSSKAKLQVGFTCESVITSIR